MRNFKIQEFRDLQDNYTETMYIIVDEQGYDHLGECYTINEAVEQIKYLHETEIQETLTELHSKSLELQKVDNSLSRGILYSINQIAVKHNLRYSAI